MADAHGPHMICTLTRVTMATQVPYGYSQDHPQKAQWELLDF